MTAFNRAVELAQDGQKEQAYSLLTELIRAYPKDTALLLWLAYTAPDLSEARQRVALASSIDPLNPNVIKARDWLAKEMAKRTFSL